MKRRHGSIDVWLCAGAALGALLSVIGYWPMRAKPQTSTVELTATAPVRPEWPRTREPRPLAYWPERANDGEAEGFDLFTPAALEIDARDRLRVKRRRSPSVASEHPLELVRVTRPPFRLQLVGFVGDGDQPSAVFELKPGNEIIIAAEGREISAAGVKVERLWVGRGLSADGLPARVATAQVRDLRTEETIELSTLNPATLGPPRAELRCTATEARLVVGSTSTVHAGHARYRVRSLGESPPVIELELIDSAPSPAPTRFVLTPP